MELNVNTVYTTVLSILNKEQRGYMTPDEFNKVATQVQLEIFEGFFQDLNQYLRMPKTDEEFASRIAHIEEEIQVFEEYKSASSHANGVYDFPQDSSNKNEVYRLGSVYFNAVPGTPQIELVGRKEYKQQLMSPLTKPSKSFPIGILKNDKVEVYPKVTTFNPTRATSISDVKFSYIRKPKDVKWGYTIGSLGQYIYDPNSFPILSTSLLVGQDLLSNTTVTSNTVDMTVISGTTGIPSNITGNVANTNGSGSGAIVNWTTDFVPATNPGNFTSIVVSTAGSGYAIGDLIKLNPEPSSNFGGNGTGTTSITLQSSNFSPVNLIQGSTDFEISESMQTEVILEILKYSGIIIRDPQIIQAAQQELVQDEANEKR